MQRLALSSSTEATSALRGSTAPMEPVTPSSSLVLEEHSITERVRFILRFKFPEVPSATSSISSVVFNFKRKYFLQDFHNCS